MAVDKGLAIIGVEFSRQSAAQQSLLQAVMECLGVGSGIVGGKGDESGMVVDENAQMGGEGFAVDRQGGTLGEIGHP